MSDGAHYGGGKTDKTHIPGELSRCLNAGGMGRQDYETETLIPVTGGFFDDATHTLRADGFDASEDGTGRGTPIIPILEAGKRCGTRNDARDGIGVGEAGDPMFTLQSNAQHAIAFDTTQITSDKNYSNPKPGDPCHPLAAGAHPPAVALTMENHARPSENRERDGVGTAAPDRQETSGGVQPALAFQTRIARNGRGQPEEIAPTLQGAGAGATSDMRPCVSSGMAVRRLTPLEAERLQGFPDNYTAIPFRGKSAADGPRYRALGNSMAVPVMAWIGKRIAMVDEIGKAGTP